MERLTSNNTWEMNMHQLALNQVYIEDGWVWYQGGVPEHDQSVCDLIRAAADTLMVELPILSDEGLSDLLADWLQYGEEEPEGILAILYRALCAMAELREKLSHYEDTGLEPDDVTDLMAAHGTAIGKLAEYRMREEKKAPKCYSPDIGGGCRYQVPDGDDEPIDKCKRCPLCYVDKQRHQSPPNTPLTLEELREMDGEPVYIKSVFGRMYAIVEVSYGRVYLHVVNNRKMCPYEFLAWEKAGGFKVYRRKPDNVPESDTGEEV